LSKNIKIKTYRTTVWHVVLCQCETSYVTLMEEQRLRVLDNRVLRKILWCKKQEMTEDCRKLCNEELCDLCHHQILVI